MFAGSFCEGSHPFQSAAGLRRLWPSPAYCWLRMARLSTKWYKGAVNNKIWKEKEEKKPKKQKSESLAFPLLGNSSVSRTDWKIFWFLEPNCFVWNLIVWRAFAEDKAAFSVESAGFFHETCDTGHGEVWPVCSSTCPSGRGCPQVWEPQLCSPQPWELGPFWLLGQLAGFLKCLLLQQKSSRIQYFSNLHPGKYFR